MMQMRKLGHSPRKILHWVSEVREFVTQTQYSKLCDGIKILKKRRTTMQGKTDLFILLASLKACNTFTDLQTGKKIHANAIESGDDSNIFVANYLLDMYVKCGSMTDARGVFDKMPNCNLAAWNCMIMGYAQNGQNEEALHLFTLMQREGFVPATRTFLGAVMACSNLAVKEEAIEVNGNLVKMGCFHRGMAIHMQAAKSGCDSDIFLASSLVDMYAKCGSMEDAREVFDKMQQQDVMSWNALILGYVAKGEEKRALQLFSRMQTEDCPLNAQTFEAALKGCTRLLKKKDATVTERSSWLHKAKAIHFEAGKRGYTLDFNYEEHAR